MLSNIFEKFNTEIIIVKKIDLPNLSAGGEGIVFYVKNGKGLLSMKYGYLENGAVAALVFGDIPLLKFHGDGPYLCPTCEKLVAAGYGLNMSDQQVSLYNSDFDQYYDWPPEILEAEKNYPDVITVARQQWAGDISDERLDRILSNNESIFDRDALNIAVALYYTQNPRFKEMTFYFCKNYNFAPVRYKIYELLANIKEEEVENFFIDFLVQNEKNYPEINKIIDRYFSDEGE